MPMESLLAALISGAVTLTGVLIANSRSQAVTDTKLEELTREVRAHNNFAQRVPVLEEITAGTIARTACLALALTNQLLSATGHPVLPIEDSQLESLITTGLTMAASIAAWWKNNSFTPAARLGDAAMARARAK